MPNTNLSEALRLASLGYPVFPCVPGEKRPLNSNGCLGATVDRDTITVWWTQTPNANIGLSTNGLCVVDVDPLNDGSPNPWFGEWIDGLDDPPKARTPRRGIHLVYSAPAGSNLRNTTGKLAPRVDTRADGGYICVAPSCTANGQYQWTKELPQRCELPVLPQWLFDRLAGNQFANSRSVDETIDVQSRNPSELSATSTSSTIPNGERNSTLASLGGFLRRGGLSETEIRAALYAANVQRCVPPLDEAEVAAIARSVSRYEPDEKTQAMAEESAKYPGEPIDWPEVQPLPIGLPPVEPFDPSMLPDAFYGWLADVSERMQTPLDFAGVGAMISLAGVVGRKICIRPKQYDDWEVIPNLWGAIIGRPGLLKSPVLQEVTRPLRRLEADARTRFGDELARFEIEHAAWKARQRQRQQQRNVARNVSDTNDHDDNLNF